MFTVTERDIQELAAKIVAEFKPQKVILFGSHANGVPHADSDVDLLVIMPVNEPRYKVAGRIRASLTPHIPIDVIVRSLDDLERNPLDVITRIAMDTGRVLYAAA
jgi:uncharacterized protein